MALNLSLYVNCIYQLWYFYIHKSFLPLSSSFHESSTYSSWTQTWPKQFYLHYSIDLKKPTHNRKNSSEHLQKHRVWFKFTSNSLRRFLLACPPDSLFTYADFLLLTLPGISMRWLKLTFFRFHSHAFKQNLKGQKSQNQQCT